ncbi:hypothetical protein L1280_000784 [Deinococcus sp. HSC-46F16]|uniref:SMP-30/gluconolactonase/LRE family protein n=1 Tax=Deinococcus sp. HSC-46F16 TaxID=2910968 RepID=UPI0020A1D035|nr:SMP-30/gluconolactonase/LRE family protein [Deinococcus sp. HSC-46F16]MCP2013656.1 hypothetical protein [Deinococcus sp. HSC-46F16]
MKTLPLSSALLGLTVLLTACPGPVQERPEPSPTTYTLTLKVEGVPQAPVTILNDATKAEAFGGSVAGSKTLTLKARDVFRVEGGAVDGFTAPTAQVVTLDGNKTVTLTYTAKTPPTPVPTTHDLTVKVEGVPQAPVTIVNDATKAEAFSGTLAGSKTFTLKAGDVFRVQGAEVEGFTAPAAQLVTLDGAKTVTLTYTAKAPPVPTTYDLTLKVEGVAQAPVTVLNDATKAEVFSGTVSGTKTLTLKAGDVFRIEGGAVNDFTAPPAQTVTLDAAKTVSLTYRAAPGVALDPSRLQGTLSGWTFGTGRVAASFSWSNTVRDLTPATVTAAGAVSGVLPAPPQVWPFLKECTFSGQRSAPDFGTEVPELGVFSAGGDLLGTVTEQTVDGGHLVQRMYSDTAGTFRGTATCGAYVYDLDLTLKQGWNAVQVEDLAPQGERQHLRVRTLAPGTRVTLAFNRAAERLEVDFRDQSELILRAGESVSREASLVQVGGISGAVTLETSVPGVTVTPSTVTLPSLAAQRVGAQGLGGQAPLARLTPEAVQTRLTFTAAANARAYSGPLDLIVKQGGREVGRRTLPLRLTAPSVSLTVGTEHVGGLFLYPGTTAGLKVNVTSVEGFSGSATVTVSDLPAGVSAQPVTAQVTPGTTTTVTIPLTVAPDAAPGTTTVRVSTPQPSVSQGPNTVQLTVRPARTAVGAAQSALASSGEGVWVLGAGRFDSATSVYRTELTRYVGLQAGARATVPFGVGSLIALPGGDVLATGTDERVARITAAGEVTLLPRPTGLYGGVADGQGRVWFVQRVSEPTGGTRTALVRWTPGTAANDVVVVDDKASYGQQGRLVASGDGKVLVYLPAYSSAALRVDTQTGTVGPLGAEVSDQGGSVAISDAGTVWLTRNGAVGRLNADGSLTTFNDLRVERLFGFDRQNPDVLWGADYTSVFRIDARSGKAARIQLGEVPAGVTVNGGGLAVLTAEYDNASSTRQGYLSILR